MSLHLNLQCQRAETRKPHRRKTRTTTHPRFLSRGARCPSCQQPQKPVKPVRSAAVNGPLKLPLDSVNTLFQKTFMKAAYQASPAGFRMKLLQGRAGASGPFACFRPHLRGPHCSLRPSAAFAVAARLLHTIQVLSRCPCRQSS